MSDDGISVDVLRVRVIDDGIEGSFMTIQEGEDNKNIYKKQEGEE